MSWESGSEDPVSYESKCSVRMQLPWRQWTNWNDRSRGGPRLTVRGATVEVVAAQGMMLDPRHLVLPGTATSMWKDRVGFSGLPIGARDSIVLASRSNVGSVWVALSGLDIAPAWEAIRSAGVLVLNSPPPRAWYLRVGGGPLRVPGID